MDDRACFVALLRTAELLRDQELDMDLYIVGSVCEETGGVGARVLAQGLSPDFCVAVDVTHGKTPDSPKEGAFVHHLHRGVHIFQGYGQHSGGNPLVGNLQLPARGSGAGLYPPEGGVLRRQCSNRFPGKSHRV